MSLALRRRLPLFALIALCATPVVGPYLLWFFWQPSEFSNYGELVEPRVMPDVVLEPLVPAARGAGTLPSTTDATLRGKWFLLIADGAACDARCERKLYHIRQLRTMQGKDMERVERVWLIDDRSEPGTRLHESFAGTWVVRRPDPALIGALPVQVAGDARDHIYLVDPLGNLMMRYPPDADPSRIRKDLTRLLKYSRIG
ncbi:MAG: cytochrome C oxidase subunit I [Proteobacteria bacterium]|nr:cytochrome C oxidase subunit I [Burkholderiales bacterium]